MSTDTTKRPKRRVVRSDSGPETASEHPTGRTTAGGGSGPQNGAEPSGVSYGYDAQGHAHTLTDSGSGSRRQPTARTFFIGLCLDCGDGIWSPSRRARIPLCPMCRRKRERRRQRDRERARRLGRMRSVNRPSADTLAETFAALDRAVHPSNSPTPATD